MSTEDNTNTSQKPTPEAPSRVEAVAKKDPAVRKFIIAGMALAGGLWLFYDGHLTDHYPYTPMAEDMNAFFSWVLNYFGGLVLIPIGLLFAIRALLELRKKIVGDDQGIGFEGKRPIAWNDITAVDAGKLANKQILVLKANAQTLTLDAYKHENFKPLVAMVEQNVPAEKIHR